MTVHNDDFYDSNYSSDSDNSDYEANNKKHKPQQKQESAFESRYLPSPVKSTASNRSPIKQPDTFSNNNAQYQQIEPNSQHNSIINKKPEPPNIEDSDSSDDEFNVTKNAGNTQAIFTGTDPYKLQAYISTVLIAFNNTQRIVKELSQSKFNTEKEAEDLKKEIEILKFKIREQQEHLTLLDAAENVKIF